MKKKGGDYAGDTHMCVGGGSSNNKRKKGGSAVWQCPRARILPRIPVTHTHMYFSTHSNSEENSKKKRHETLSKQHEEKKRIIYLGKKGTVNVTTAESLALGCSKRQKKKHKMEKTERSGQHTAVAIKSTRIRGSAFSSHHFFLFLLCTLFFSQEELRCNCFFFSYYLSLLLLK
jgi:hypothetical protein